MIDNLVKASMGAYTHDEVFNLDVKFCYTLLLMYAEQEAYSRRKENRRKELNEYRNKK